jgi:DNA-binding NtrC family response regulator
LKNEIQRAVAMSAPGGVIDPVHLSADIGSTELPSIAVATPRSKARGATSLAAAIEQIERDMIQAALDRNRGNISASARLLGLTRRGLYLKLRRLGLAARADVDIRYLDIK